MVTGPEIRKIVNDRILEVTLQISREMKETGKNQHDVLINNPFLAGEAHILAMLTLDLIAAGG